MKATGIKSIDKTLIYLCFVLFTITSFGQQITIYTIGDSTMANKVCPEENPERGWGQMLPDFFTKNVKIDNRAVNGRSTRSFIDLKHWESVYNALKPGDYVFIQFGHNDGKLTDPTRYTNPQTSYRYNLIRFITETKSKGAIPILFTSITRRNFNEEGTLLDTHGNYTLVARLVAQEQNIPLIDMQYYTEMLEESYGKEKSKELHLHFAKGENSYFPEGKDDNTHLSIKGATAIAKIAITQLQLLNTPLNKEIKPIN